MNVYAKLLITVMLAGLALPADAQTTQPGFPKPKLTFEKSDKKVVWRDATYHGGIGPIVPTYAAVAKIEVESWFEVQDNLLYGYGESDVSNLDSNRGRVVREIKSSSLWPALSPEQRKFWETSSIITTQADKHFERDGKKFPIFTVSFFAVSEADARLMAEGVIESLNEMRYKRVENVKKDLASYKKQLEEAQSEISRLQGDLKKMNAEVATLQNTFHYTNSESAFSEFVEMDKLVRLINIDIAGVKARMEAIKEIAVKTYVHNMEEKLTDLNIEMAGLLARKKAAQDDRDQAKRYYDLLKDVEKAEATVRVRTAEVQKYQPEVTSREKTLSNPPEEMRPVKVLDNKVVIHPAVPQFEPKGAR